MHASSGRMIAAVLKLISVPALIFPFFVKQSFGWGQEPLILVVFQEEIGAHSLNMQTDNVTFSNAV